MRRHLQNQLFEKYQDLLDRPAMRWGIQCGDGWFDILDKLFALLEYKHSQRANDARESDLKPPRIFDVKEKYGVLRVKAANTDSFSDGAIAMAEALSSRVCEECGKPGKAIREGWISTMCEEHQKDKSERWARVREELNIGN